MATFRDHNEVLMTTSKALQVSDAKYLSSDPKQFDVASFTMNTNLSNVSPHYTPINPASYTQLPPVYVDEAALDAELEQNLDLYKRQALPPDWCAEYHYSITDYNDEEQAKAMCQYVFVLDALNFCFWPLPGYEYEHLASSLKDSYISNPQIFSAKALSCITPEQLSQYLQPNLKQWPLIVTPHNISSTQSLPIPLLHSRVRLLQELGSNLLEHFDGLAYNVVKQAQYSVKTLIKLITQYFPGFRDNSQFYGDQIFFYKRVQILCGDIYGAFKGNGIGAFIDMEYLTCFPDYRIPQLFRSLGVIRTTDEFGVVLNNDQATKQNVLSNSEEEILLRCWTVQVVELIKNKLLQKYNVTIHAYQLDWLLWERGEKLMKENKLLNHHRTLTTYY